MLENMKFNNVGFYYGNKDMSKKQYKEMLYVSAKCTVILATEQLAKEGLDIPGLDTLIMTTSISDLGALEQSIGRILRKYYSDDMLGPMVIDIVDKNCGNFGKHGSKRKSFYKKETYKIEESTIHLETNEEINEEEEPQINFNNCVI
jgi:superfamily II DNA or RNA helicase